jgi:hypothetical protein
MPVTIQPMLFPSGIWRHGAPSRYRVLALDSRNSSPLQYMYCTARVGCTCRYRGTVGWPSTKVGTTSQLHRLARTQKRNTATDDHFAWDLRPCIRMRLQGSQGLPTFRALEHGTVRPHSLTLSRSSCYEAVGLCPRLQTTDFRMPSCPLQVFYLESRI